MPAAQHPHDESMDASTHAALPRTAAASGHDAQALVRDGAGTYAQALAAARGQQVEALPSAGDRAGVCAAIYMSPPYELRVPPLRVPRLSINLTRAFVSGGIEGERPRRFNVARYSLFLTPAGAAVNWHKDAPSRHLSVYFHAADFGERDDDEPPFGEEPVFNAGVPGMGLLVDQLAAELSSPTMLSAEAADSLGRLMLVRLARHRRDATRSHGLTPKVLARLRDYVAEHLSERILVADLARQAGLPPNRFACCHSRQTGQSPHQFVLALRLEHAAAMLRQPAPSVADVAHACGFANQQHLSNAMRRHLGTTPGRYRAAHQKGRGP